MGEERHQAVVQPELTVGDVDERVFPPCPFMKTRRRAGVIATERPRSSSTASSVDGDSQTVPGAQACSFDLV